MSTKAFHVPRFRIHFVRDPATKLEPRAVHDALCGLDVLRTPLLRVAAAVVGAELGGLSPSAVEALELEALTCSLAATRSRTLILGEAMGD